MKKDDQQFSQSRRRFLRDAGVGGGIAAVAATAPGIAAAETTDAPVGPEKPEGYRLTAHILAYYKSTTS